MAKADIGTQFTLPFNEITMEQNINMKDRAREAFVLDRLHEGEISTDNAAKQLNLSRDELSELMYKIKS